MFKDHPVSHTTLILYSLRNLWAIWHCSCVHNFVLRSGCVKIGLCRDYTMQNLFGNIMLNYSLEKILCGTCLVTLEKICSRKQEQVNCKIYNIRPTFILFAALLFSDMRPTFKIYNVVLTFIN